ncbi:methylated-DNA--[protein]-cysteine S-methyltransferase [Desulfitibacter alkalitolerans]|uniref:methylated-DNA--[protein]-cysteine S-methyltransferase n=1 Tax=Desulfitibacter alkalitolerans TaxID=264641 RepID=UPI000489B8A8|nr:methylated-DNA--[protein]-cysteine S-methyltransferase [Desulfitibacter alkalitolerans]
MDIKEVVYSSPIGLIRIKGSFEGITSMDFSEEGEASKEIPDCLMDCHAQLEEYFRGQRKDFSLNLIITGTSFQRQVYEKLIQVPYGKTASYKDIAAAVGNERAVRAVGGANNKNKHAIVIPCHRIIGSNGSLIGYGSGLWRKKWLLEHEQAFL